MKLRITDDIIDTVGTIHRLCAIISRRPPGHDSNVIPARET
jgi:hypothetical protein